MTTLSQHRPVGPTATNSISLIRSTPPTPSWLGEELAKTLVEIAGDRRNHSLLRYHKFTGSINDREVGAEWLSLRLGHAPNPSRIIITNGTQNAMLLAMLRTVGSGNTLLVDSVSYYGVRRIAALLGIAVVAVPMDSEGAIPMALEDTIARSGAKALLLQPTLHNPTSMVMSETRRRELLDIARRYRISVIEDDVYGLLVEGGPPALAQLAPDITWFATGPAKCIAPGLRIGYLVAPTESEAEEAFRPLDVVTTWHTSPLSAEIMKSWILSGIVEKLRFAVREEAKERQSLASTVLLRQSFQSHPNSLYIWLERYVFKPVHIPPL
ncbi:PLP-dependent aminotransferase family protein [Sinorhizobium meliloti]|uniref:aminotransferase-like domain-containing protein n=1 Tax=Rhizobium meliloti TaxID=382 RepID=UPI000FDA1F3C|nr:PLP-dependent aminotransferase family protein [Sinorhizobium meliloti]RVK43497.1 PLP-dependent aminotransferase family protein [Sinorhizobium meliloti]